MPSRTATAVPLGSFQTAGVPVHCASTIRSNRSNAARQSAPSAVYHRPPRASNFGLPDGDQPARFHRRSTHPSDARTNHS